MFKVYNHTGDDFIGRHNGADYAFPKDSPVYVDEAACTHIFGLGTADKTTVLARHGWAGVGKTYQDGMSVLNKFVFEHVQQQLDAPLARAIMEQAEEQIAASSAPVVDDHVAAPVIQGAPATNGGADEPSESAGAVEDSGKSRKRA